MNVGLSSAEIEAFVCHGFIKIEKAFPRVLAEEGRKILWQETGCRPDDPSTWRKPVVWLGNDGHQPFREAVTWMVYHRLKPPFVWH